MVLSEAGCEGLAHEREIGVNSIQKRVQVGTN